MQTVCVKDTDGIRTLTLNRPERRNALTPEMQEELTATLDAAGQASNVRVVVLTGAGEAFCAGLDLAVLEAMLGADEAALEANARRVARLLRTLYELPKPTIARVNGHAVAGGTGLATVCDYTLASPHARFGFTEARIGFVPALVSAFLALQVGDKRARGLLLSARLFTAAEANGLGLVTEVVESADLDMRTRELAHTLMANSPASLSATKRLLADQNRAWLDHAIELAVAANARSRQHPDFAEGVTAFLAKRTPHWRP